MISGADAALLAAPARWPALAGTAGGITSLISYPALLLAGRSAAARERGQRGRAGGLLAGLGGRVPARAARPRRLAGPLGAGRRGGRATGAVLLVSTPPGVFTRVVPFLLAAAALALLLQPRLSAWRDRRQRRAGALVLAAGLFAVSAYNGYFGAGAGVMLLALMLLTTDQHLARANALKNMLLGAASVVGAITFILLGPVDWAAVAPLAAGMLAGSVAGPLITRRTPPALLRWLVALTGLGVAVRLWAAPAL